MKFLALLSDGAKSKRFGAFCDKVFTESICSSLAPLRNNPLPFTSQPRDQLHSVTTQERGDLLPPVSGPRPSRGVFIGHRRIWRLGHHRVPERRVLHVDHIGQPGQQDTARRPGCFGLLGETWLEQGFSTVVVVVVSALKSSPYCPLRFYHLT